MNLREKIEEAQWAACNDRIDGYSWERLKENVKERTDRILALVEQERGSNKDVNLSHSSLPQPGRRVKWKFNLFYDKEDNKIVAATGDQTGNEYMVFIREISGEEVVP